MTTENTFLSSEISEFYKNKSIFITGATGFVGKVLIEKLLRSCYDLNHIYILVRHKKGKTPNQRLDELCDCKLYEKVRELYPDYKTKLTAIEGDLIEPNLGISQENRKILVKNVNIVFHSAATVRFDEPLKVAIAMNIVGVKRVIELCKELEDLKVFVHVSTAYANCDLAEIKEEVYTQAVQPGQLISAAEWMEDDLVNHITPRLIKNKPNTYTYTKAVAEMLVLDECKDIPCLILRPSIICCVANEPLKGWIDNFNGPTALFPACGSGILRTMVANTDLIADIIPVDVIVNFMIATAWYRAVGKTQKTLVFNCTSGQINKFTWNMMEEYGFPLLFKYPFENIFFVPNPRFTHYKSVKVVRTFFEQLIPAYVMDFFLKIFKRKPIFVKLQGKIKKAIDILEYFTTHDWKFQNDNLYLVLDEMNEVDRKVFNFDIRDLDWRVYFEDYYLGVKTYLMKEDMTKLNACKRRMTKIKRIQNFAFFSFCGIALKCIYSRSAYFQAFTHGVYENIYENIYEKLF